MSIIASIKELALSLGFDDLRVSSAHLEPYTPYYKQWIARGFHGDMFYLVKHGHKRLHPSFLESFTRSVLMVRMNYLPPSKPHHVKKEEPHRGVIARYAFGHDYHDVLRARLNELAKHIQQLFIDKQLQYRVFVDSAPILEKPLAQLAGLGWQGKNSLIINKDAGSWFFIGTLLTDLELPADSSVEDLCGSCQACLKICPTQAIIAPKILDAKKCISYLTIEYKGSIPLELRPLLGQRIFGCDDCQSVCPWNRFAKTTLEEDFWDKRGLTSPDLLWLYTLSAQEYLDLFKDTPLIRTGYEAWLRNVAVAIGNAPGDKRYLPILQERSTHPSSLVAEHAGWALQQQLSQLNHTLL